MNQSTQSLSLALFFLMYFAISATAQYDYTINGKLGLDTVPERTLDVNGDGHFKGELLLDDDLRMTKLASNDSLIEKLVYIDENGRMQRLSQDGARDIVEYINTLDCRYADVDGVLTPIVYWNTSPGKITAHDEGCGAPDVGIGTNFPKARLDVRGTGYFQEKVGIGIVNESNSEVHINTSLTDSPLLMTGSYLEEGEWVQHKSFEFFGNGHVSFDQSKLGAWNYGLQIIPGNNDLKSFAIRSLENDADRFVVFGDGRISQSVENNGLSAFTINNTTLDEDVFQIGRDGHVKMTTNDENKKLLSIHNSLISMDAFQIWSNGNVWATAVHVRELGSADFPDYVFEPDYELMPLNKLKTFIHENHRLPNMPSAEEVKRNGMDLGELNRLLVEKVEELTLYIFELEDRLKKLEDK